MTNTYDLSDKTAVITGGAGDIGRAVAERLLASGAQVWISDTESVTMDGVHLLPVDITDSGQIAGAIAHLIQSGSRINILINSAGYLGQLRTFEEHDPDDWHRIVRMNLLGVLEVTRLVIPYMRQWGGGRIINLGSLAGKEGLAQLAAYSAASAGVIAFTKALCREMVGHGILVNCVAPGPMDTKMIRGLGEAAVAKMIADSPMNRLGAAGEAAHLVAWLCSDASHFNTGAIFDMSGGRARY
jgi:NAD(P)-dependent dehydrogenase (short-subunit alcohol dehydrogenase family)